LILKNGSSSFQFFRSADTSSRKNEAIIWSRIKNQPDHFVNDVDMANQILLENPMAVFFGQELMISLRFKDYPCKIVCTSKALFSVQLDALIFRNN
jgi:hypothetical protein